MGLGRGLLSRRRGRGIVAVATTAALGATMVVAAAGTAGAATPELAYNLSAYATQASVAGVVTSSPTFPAGIGCTIASNLSYSAGNGAVSAVPGILNLGAATTSAATSEPDGVQTGVSTAHATGVSLLSGALTIGALTEVTTTTNTNGVIASTSTLNVANVSVLGLPVEIGPDVPANTGLTVPGIATVVLNKVTPIPGSGQGGQQGIGLEISLLTGTTVDAASTEADFLPSPPALVTGVAYSNNISTGNNLLSVGPLSAQGPPCYGGTRTNSLTGISLPGILTTGAVNDTGTVAINGNQVTGSTTAQIAGLNLLGGLVTADAVTAKANVASNNGVVTVADTGTQLANLRVLNAPVSAATAPNTTLVLGRGATIRVTVDAEARTASSISVTSLQVILLVPLAGLPIYTEIDLNGANIGVGSTAGPAAVLGTGHAQTEKQLVTVNTFCAKQKNPKRCLGI